MSGLTVVPQEFSTDVWDILFNHPAVRRGLMNSLLITGDLTAIESWLSNARETCCSVAYLYAGLLVEIVADQICLYQKKADLAAPCHWHANCCLLPPDHMLTPISRLQCRPEIHEGSGPLNSSTKKQIKSDPNNKFIRITDLTSKFECSEQN